MGSPDGRDVHMPGLSAALAFSAAIILGHLAGATYGDMPVLAGWLVFVATVAAAMCKLSSDSLRTCGFVVAIIAVGLAHGMTAVARVPWRVEQHGVRSGVNELVVRRASMPGPRCSFLADSGTGALWHVAGRTDPCRFSEGQRVRLVRAGIREPTRELPGDRDPSMLARTAGAAATIEFERAWNVDRPTSVYWDWVATTRRLAFESSQGNESLGFVMAVLVGVQPALPPEQRARLRRAGLGHVVAVSGLQVALAAWLARAPCLRLALILGASTRMAVVVSCVPVLAYAGLTGGSAPVFRAAMMAVLSSLAVVVGRASHGMTVLAIVTAGMLFHRPAWCEDPGFQMSVAAMAVIVHAPSANLIAQTWKITWILAPICAWHFDSVPWVGVLTNVVAIPVFALWIVPWGLVGALLVPWFGSLAFVPASWGGALVLDVARVGAAVPPGAWWWTPSLALLFLLIAVLRRPGTARWPWLPPPIACMCLVACTVYQRVEWRELPGVWYAVGSQRTLALVMRSTDQPRTACVEPTALDPARWVSLLHALGFRSVASTLEASHDPHVEAVRDELLASGRFDITQAKCPEIESSRARTLLDACLRRSTTRVAIVRSDETSSHCFALDGWSRLTTEMRVP